MRYRLLAVAVLAAAVSGWLAFRLWPRRLALLPPRPPVMEVALGADGVSLRMPGRMLVADVATFDDELLAYLMFGHLRGLVARDGCRAWLTYERRGKAIAYIIRLEPAGDYLSALFYVLRLRAAGTIQQTGNRWVVPGLTLRYAAETKTFDEAYNLPASRPLEHLPRPELVAYLRRFIQFKAATDGRILRGTGAAPHLPSRPEARVLAEDIVTVADFYSLPLDFFLGIGAMENNYMNAKGDIGRGVWKRRAAKGDVILKRGRKGVLVLNEASGIWQITRETLRYTQRLYLKDQRDYSQLPERLRPPRQIDPDAVTPDVLTTYAGLLFRTLLDEFHGDVAKAAGAYNGGPRNPNPRYSEGVELVARYARKALESAAVLHGRPAAEMRFLSAAQ